MLEHTLSQKRVTHFEKSIKEGCNGGKKNKLIVIWKFQKKLGLKKKKL